VRAIADTGGVVCIDFLPDHLKGPREPGRRVGLDDVVEVLRHAVDVAGVEGVGLGSDWDGFGGDPVGPEDVVPSRLVAALTRASPTTRAKILGGNCGGCSAFAESDAHGRHRLGRGVRPSAPLCFVSAGQVVLIHKKTALQEDQRSG
jgi:hypothetical protein